MVTRPGICLAAPVTDDARINLPYSTCHQLNKPSTDMNSSDDATVPPSTTAQESAEDTETPSPELAEKLGTKNWWEKTVEYWFVRRVMPEVADAFPMAGHEEKSFGDLLLADNNEFRLIEFKAREDGIDDEKWKFEHLFEPATENP